MNRRHGTYLALLLALTGVGESPAPAAGGAPAGGAAALAPGAAILASGPEEILLEFVPRWTAAAGTPAAGPAYLRVSFEGGHVPPPPAPGAPALPVQRIPLLLFSSSNRVEIVAAEYTDTSGVLPEPAPDIAGDGDGGTTGWLHRADPAAYAAPGFVPAELARLDDVGSVRGSLLGTLTIAPARYDAARKLLRRYSRVVVRIAAAGVPASAARPDGLVRGIALNDPGAPRGTSGPGAGGDRGSPVAVMTARSAGSVLVEGPWLRVSIAEEGMHRLTGAMLAGAGVPASVDPATIRVFGNGGAELPLSPIAPAPDDLVEIARLVRDGGTAGALDPADEVIFFSTAARGWRYDAAARRMVHTVNRFWETAYCWITWGGTPGRAMASAPVAPAADYAASSVEGKLFREDDRQNILASGLAWLGQSFGPGDRLTFVHPLPGLLPGSTVRYRFRVGARSSSPSSFTFTEHGAQAGTAAAVPATVVGSYFHDQVIFATADRSTPVTWGDEQSQLALSFSSGSAAATGFLDWYELFWERRTAAAGDRFSFHMPDTAAVVDYAVTGFSGTGVTVFDVTAPDAPVVLPAEIRSDTCAVRVAGTPGGRRHLVFAGPGGYLNPAGIVPAANQNLRGETDPADMIIVAPPALLPAAARLKAHRERPGPDRLATRVVNVEEVYNEFGGGMPSPMAIRNYLKFATAGQSPPPRYALLFGDGDYDYRRAVASGPMLMPPWETESSFRPIDTYASDDYYALFDGGERVQLALGRLTARDASEADAMVDKIVEYETAPVMDSWRTLVTFVADDGLAAPGDDDRFLHLQHAENVANTLPDLFDRSKIYLFDYPTEISSAGRRKPGVNRAIREAIDRGTLVLNFSGHGNPRLWAHEAVFVREDDIPLLANKGRYFLLIAATCNYAYFDAIADQSGGEILAAMRDAGAIAGISASRVVYAFQNLRLNSTLFSYLFEEDSLGRMTTRRLGDAMFRTKQVLTDANDEKYFLLGDPALRPAFPRRLVVVDSVNGTPLDSVVDLYALGVSSVSARVAPEEGAAPWSGTASLTVHDADRLVTITDPTAGTYVYRAAGDILFRGQATVSADRLRAEFIVPKDISHGTENGRIAVYASGGGTDGSGYTRRIRIAGTDSTAAPDTRGPDLAVYLDSRDFRQGDEVSASPVLIVDIADSSGINTSRAGIGHRLEAWIDDDPSSADLSDFYRSRPDTYREGVVTYPLGTLAAGVHRVKVRAWDTHNNSSTAEASFSVGGAGGLRLAEVYAYPNPSAGSTFITFRHDHASAVDVEVKIYTVAGRLIRSIEERGHGERFVRLPWDGRDREGDEVANGTYLYKVIARTTDGRYSGEALGKLSVTR